jgi:hypothetical protein
MNSLRFRMATAVLIGLGSMAGCASSPAGPEGPVRLVTSESALGRDVVLIDATTMRVPRRDRGSMNQAARDYARSLDADVALIRVIDDKGPEILFTVSVYRRFSPDE